MISGWKEMVILSETLCHRTVKVDYFSCLNSLHLGGIELL